MGKLTAGNAAALSALCMVTNESLPSQWQQKCTTAWPPAITAGRVGREWK